MAIDRDVKSGSAATDEVTAGVAARIPDPLPKGWVYGPELRDLMAGPEPQLVYKAVADRCPFYRQGDNDVSVVRMSDILALNRSRDVAGVGGGAIFGLHGEVGRYVGGDHPMIPLELDGDEHKKYRKLLDPVFAPKRIALLEPHVQAVADDLISKFVRDGEVELFKAYCQPLPSAIFLRISGLPAEDLTAFFDYKENIIRPEGKTQEEQQEKRYNAGAWLYGYLGPELERRRKEAPRDDIISWLIDAEVDGERMDDGTIIEIMLLLTLAGLDTVAASISCIFEWLARHPSERRRLVEDPSIVPAAVEELLRFETPVASGSRHALSDVDLPSHGHLHRGDSVQAVWASANLDQEVFEDPLTVDFDRQPNPHVAFASGFHRCLGSHLARLELRVAVTALHRHISDYWLEPDDEARYEHMGVRTVCHLPLAFTAR